MTAEMIIVIIAILLMLVGLFFEIARPDLLVFGTLFFFLMMGYVDTEQALSGFSNEGMLTIALLFIVAGVFERSGLIERLIGKFLANTNSERGALMKLLLPISGFSAFVNNTPIVVTLTPIIKKWAAENNISPSKFLIPLSYASIIGGTITLMGTSTNLVIHGLLLQEGDLGFTFFQLAWVGLPVTIIGVIYLILFGPKILPNNQSLIDKVKMNTKDYLSEMAVTYEFPSKGRTVEEAGLRNLKGLYLIEILRENKSISPVTGETMILEGDRLLFTGMLSTIADLQKRKGLTLDTGTDISIDDVEQQESPLVEAVVSHQSYLLGRTIKQSRFREKYNAAVLAVHRNDELVQGKIGDIVPKAGDLLLLVTGENFDPHQDHRDFYTTSPVDEQKFYESENKGWFALVLLLSMIALVTFQVISIFKAMVITVGVLIVTKAITPRQAKQSVQFQVLLLIASALGIGSVIKETGTAEFLGNSLVNSLAPLGVIAILGSIYMMTNIFTELITNNAAAVIMFPIGLEVASSVGIEPIGMAVLVAIAASASFLSPIGYQTNLIVYGPGGYTFKDYLKSGFPLTLLVMITTIMIVHIKYI
ncbi:SLC13 family permease [Pontibacillus yanchengensis]|uniref:Potassium transporter TrkA n=1 Tax=Pontibacillus yanchengensis Y32 TaxID=1385514 RepID=A0A0A2TG73_9BACI|nr:SLC13 family permease [Pontibacillus yanchengensis]KGP74559.1 potassium transporter TrkA [Pontibacillus yanchengensis Y32]